MNELSGRLSVVIPAFNASRFLEQTVVAALNQTGVSVDVILVDDGSTDGTLDVAEKLRAQFGITVVAADHGGPASARNRGLALVTAERVAFLDSDDLWDSGKSLRQMELFEEDPEAVAVGCRMRYVSASGRTAGVCGVSPEEPEMLRALRRAVAVPFPLSCIIFDSATARAVGGFDTELPHVDDLDFLAKVSNAGRVTWVPEILGSYRVHANSLSSRHPGRQQACAEYVAARAQGRLEPGMDWERFWAGNASPQGEGRSKRARRWFRHAGVAAINGHYIRAARYMLGALALDPRYAVDRLRLRAR